MVNHVHCLTQKGGLNTSRIGNFELYAYFKGKKFWVSRKKMWIAKGLGSKVCWWHPGMLCQCQPMFQFGTWDGSIVEKREVCSWWEAYQKVMIACKEDNLEWIDAIGYILDFWRIFFLKWPYFDKTFQHVAKIYNNFFKILVSSLTCNQIWFDGNLVIK
jgi:hypothetical protein